MELCFGRKSREVKSTERKERRFRAQFLFVLFGASALFELFRVLFLACLNSLLFSPKQNKQGERLKREVCFENNNRERERERERVRESVSGRCF